MYQLFHKRITFSKPSFHQLNPFIKIFIMAEIFAWFAWSLMQPLAGIYVVEEIADGTVQSAATMVSVMLILRIFAETIIGQLYVQTKDTQKIKMVLVGTILAGCAMLLLGFVNSVAMVFGLFGLLGVGFGIGTPTKLAFFTRHMDKDQETSEWGMYDAVTMIGMAIASALGGVVVAQFGFRVLFTVSGIIMVLSVIPYISYLRDINE